MRPRNVVGYIETIQREVDENLITLKVPLDENHLDVVRGLI